MSTLHPAARAEDAFHSAVAGVLGKRGFKRRIIGFTGYGSTSKARVIGRVVLSNPKHADVPTSVLEAPVQPGIRAFFAAPLARQKVKITLGDATLEVVGDRGGYFDVELEGHGLPAGWQHAELVCGRAVTNCPVQIIGDDVRFGIISDIDDTCLITSLPRPMIAAYNTFVLDETARRVVPGMAAFYRSVLAHHEGAPLIYLSTGAWNTQPVLTRFFARRGFPTGAMLMTDWGATETSMFRSGAQHKHDQLRRLARDLPHIKWLLVGDDGQHDPELYDNFADDCPENVDAIAIRQLTVAQQVLSHGHPGSRDDGRSSPAPKIEGPDGYALFHELNDLRRREKLHA